jgi:alpha-ketoglutarate-dependent taurine dioxygenase
VSALLMVKTATVRRIGKTLGAEVMGLDLAQPCVPTTLNWLRSTLQEHHVLCVRKQILSEQQQLAFSEQLGSLEAFPEKDKTKSESTIYNVANVSAEGQHLPVTDHRVIFQLVNARWHTDSSYRYIPSFASLLYGIEVLPDDAPGGETEFSNMFAAYDALPNDLKQRLQPLHMVHSYEFGRRMFPELPPLTQTEREFVPPTSHPLVRVHPDRGNRRSLFMTANAGNEVSGMSLEEGQALHRQLHDHVSNPAFCYLHRWQKGDFVIWDNRCTLHRARAYDMAQYRRVFRRTTIAGAGPVLGPYSQAVVQVTS